MAYGVMAVLSIIIIIFTVAITEDWQCEYELYVYTFNGLFTKTIVLPLFLETYLRIVFAFHLIPRRTLCATVSCAQLVSVSLFYLQYRVDVLHTNIQLKRTQEVQTPKVGYYY